MDPLFKAALLRTLGLLLWASLSAWLFVIVEHTEINDRDEKYQRLQSLYEFLAYKYNMSVEEFNNISNMAYEALSEPKPQWTYSTASSFVVQALTTIGKEALIVQTSCSKLLEQFAVNDPWLGCDEKWMMKYTLPNASLGFLLK